MGQLVQSGDVYQTYTDMGGLEQGFGFKPDAPIKVGLARFAERYRSSAWHKGENV
jgi:hypothetical protein